MKNIKEMTETEIIRFLANQVLRSYKVKAINIYREYKKNVDLPIFLTYMQSNHTLKSQQIYETTQELLKLK